MNAHVSVVQTGELVDDFTQFFPPMSTDLVDSLVAQYDAAKANIMQLAEMMSSDKAKSVLGYFLDGNLSDENRGTVFGLDNVFNPDGAIGKLNADFWTRAFNLTDVYDCMPQARRDEWNEQIRNPRGVKKDRYSDQYLLPPLPAFEADTVRATLFDLLNSRERFFAERVDGIFRSLSRTHVTNQPQGFSKRMIVSGVIDSWGHVSWSRAGSINDLRCIIARFMGRDEPHHGATKPVIQYVRQRNGEWALVDGGALRMRVYNGVGTVHLEVHPDIAWRLNAVLASLYPAAIPSELREKPKRQRKIKDFVLFDRPIPFVVLQRLDNLKHAYVLKEKAGFRAHQFTDVPMTRVLPSDLDKATKGEIERILTAIGGVPDKLDGKDIWRFNYEPTDVIGEIVCSGCIPDQKSHQFYPTPEGLAAEAVAIAQQDAEVGMLWLEPSAGIGGLADLMPEPLCVEINELHCKVLDAKEHAVVQEDFLKWRGDVSFDRIVMNPPFSEGRWQAHLEHASTMLAADGVLVAIIPASAKGKQVLEGFDLEWSKVYDNEFAGCSASVVILKAVRTA